MVLVAVSLISCGKQHPGAAAVRPFSPAENVARWPKTHGIASSSEAWPFPVSNLNDGSPEAWGSTAQPGSDVYAALVLPTPQAIQEYRIELFSPAQPPRAHLRDIRVITADSEEADGPKWRVVRSRLSASEPFSYRVTVPPGDDESFVRLEIDRSDPNWGPHKIWGFGCFTASQNDVRNFLPPGKGTGVYVRELQMSTGYVLNLPTTHGTLTDGVLDFLASEWDALAVLLIAVLLIGSIVSPALRWSERPRLVPVVRIIARYQSYGVVILLAGALTVGLLAIIFRAFSTDKILQWDETYYANIAVMGAHGFGLYPATQNMLPTHLMGGVGYLVYLYVWAVKMFGATIYSLRFVALAAMIIALIPIYLTLRMWYDPLTGLVAVALAPSLYLYQLSDTARMDAITMAVAAWLLFVVAIAFKKQRWRWHLLAGLVAGLALQAHIDTLAVTIACGLLYLVNCCPIASRPKTGLTFLNALAPFVLGFGITLGVYVVFNILPDPQSFFQAMSFARPAILKHGTVDAPGLLQSILSPTVVMNKELQRYHELFQAVPLFESLLFGLGIIALFTRRALGDKLTLVLLVGAMAGGALIFYHPLPKYMIHLFPIVILPVAPLFTRGFTGRGEVTSANMPAYSVIALMVAMVLLLHEPGAYVMTWPTLFPRSTDAPEIVARVKRTVSPECYIAGDRALYVPYFLNYPRFRSTVRTEEYLGVMYLGGVTLVELWAALQPDVVFGSLDERIQPYIEQAHYKLIGKDIWLKTETELTKGCVITTSR
jgi:hypothetical protein